MSKWVVCGYMFDCDEFVYNGRRITGLCCEVKANQDIESPYVAVQITKEEGFTIVLDSKATDIVVQPYKIYFLALCSNLEEEPIEVDHETLAQYSDYIINGIHTGYESSWLLEEG